MKNKAFYDVNNDTDVVFDYRFIQPPQIAYFVTTTDEFGNVNSTPVTLGTCNSANLPRDNKPSEFYMTFALGKKAIAEDGNHIHPRDGYINLLHNDEVVISYIPKRLMRESIIANMPFPRGISELDVAGLTTFPSTNIIVPSIVECPINIECKVINRMDIGETYMLYVAKVVGLSVDEELIKKDNDGFGVYHIDPIFEVNITKTSNDNIRLNYSDLFGNIFVPGDDFGSSTDWVGTFENFIQSEQKRGKLTDKEVKKALELKLKFKEDRSNMKVKQELTKLLKKGGRKMIPLTNPKPDIDHFINVVKGKELPKKVLFGELKVDDDLLREIAEKVFDLTWVDRQKKDLKKRAQYWDNVIHIFYHLGYDFVRVSRAISFPNKQRLVEDTSEISSSNRTWAEEGEGVIKDMKSFEDYPWPSADDVDLWDFEYVSKNLPEGMGMMVCPSWGILEAVVNVFLGFTGLSYAMYDNPELVDVVFKKTGDLLYEVYERIVSTVDCVGFFQGDDMGYNSGLMFSDKFLRKYVIPWHKKVADLAHKNDLIYILHSCGNLRKIGDDIISLGADVKHSFEDNGLSVKDYKDLYGNQICIMGGVDVDKLVRNNTEELKQYCNDILNHCMPGGRYIYGSGNSVTNYVSIKNYFTMLETGMNYKIKERK